MVCNNILLTQYIHTINFKKRGTNMKQTFKIRGMYIWEDQVN